MADPLVTPMLAAVLSTIRKQAIDKAARNLIDQAEVVIGGRVNPNAPTTSIGQAAPDQDAEEATGDDVTPASARDAGGETKAYVPTDGAERAVDFSADRLGHDPVGPNVILRRSIAAVPGYNVERSFIFIEELKGTAAVTLGGAIGEPAFIIRRVRNVESDLGPSFRPVTLVAPQGTKCDTVAILIAKKVGQFISYEAVAPTVETIPLFVPQLALPSIYCENENAPADMRPFMVARWTEPKKTTHRIGQWTYVDDFGGGTDPVYLRDRGGAAPSSALPDFTPESGISIIFAGTAGGKSRLIKQWAGEEMVTRVNEEGVSDVPYTPEVMAGLCAILESGRNIAIDSLRTFSYAGLSGDTTRSGGIPSTVVALADGLAHAGAAGSSCCLAVFNPSSAGTKVEDVVGALGAAAAALVLVQASGPSFIRVQASVRPGASRDFKIYEVEV